MKEKMKKIIALVLAVLMIFSGVLSGIPGGGIARAEEWDIGSEIIGDEYDVAAVALGQEMAEVTPEEKLTEEPSPSEDEVEETDPFEQEVTEETASSQEENAGLQETFNEESEEGSPFGVSEESEDGEEETLTNTIFGEYDPSSTAESSFDETIPSEQEAEGFTDEEGVDFGSEEENTGYIEEEENEENISRQRNEHLAGTDSGNYVYFMSKHSWWENKAYWVYDYSSGQWIGQLAYYGDYSASCII